MPIPYEDARGRHHRGRGRAAAATSSVRTSAGCPTRDPRRARAPEHLDARLQAYSAQVYPGTLATNLWKGTYYGLPLDTNTRVLLYDASLFEKAGVAVPTTVDELMAAACAQEGGRLRVCRQRRWWLEHVAVDLECRSAITDEGVTKASGYLNSAASVKGVQNLVDVCKAATCGEHHPGRLWWPRDERRHQQRQVRHDPRRSVDVPDLGFAIPGLQGVRVDSPRVRAEACR